FPDEPAPIFEKDDPGIFVDPAGWPLLAHDGPGDASLRIRSGQLEHVLTPIRPEEDQFAAIARPLHVIHVVADDAVVEGPAAPDVDAHRLVADDVVDVEVDDRIGRARGRKGFHVDGGLSPGLAERHVIIRDLRFVESIEGKLPVVRGPPHRAPLVELLAVDPAGRSVLHAARGAAVSRHRAFVAPVGWTQPDVAIAVAGQQPPVRRRRRGELTPAFGRFGRGRSGPFAGTRFDGLDFLRAPRRDVEAIVLAALRVLNRVRVNPGRRQRPAPDQRPSIFDALDALVSGHRPQPILRGERQRQRRQEAEPGPACVGHSFHYIVDGMARLIARQCEADVWDMWTTPPHPALRPYITEYCGYDERVLAGRRMQVPHPDVVLIIGLGPRMRVVDPRRPADATIERLAFVAGVHDAYVFTESMAPTRGLQANLTPIGAHLLFGVPMDALANRVVELDDLFGADATRLIDGLCEARTWSQRFDILDEAILGRVLSAPAPNPL